MRSNSGNANSDARPFGTERAGALFMRVSDDVKWPPAMLCFDTSYGSQPVNVALSP
jgi:hypothetical protein